MGAGGLFEKKSCKGEILFSEGDNGSELYVLLTGAVEVTKKGFHIATISNSGDYFGELSALLGVPRTGTVTVVKDATLLVVTSDRLRELFEKTPQLALRMTTTLARRLAKTTTDLVDLVENCVWEHWEKTAR